MAEQIRGIGRGTVKAVPIILHQHELSAQKKNILTEWICAVVCCFNFATYGSLCSFNLFCQSSHATIESVQV